MICPKCGSEQPDGPECLRCGIVLAEHRGLVAQPTPAPQPPPALAAADAPVQETFYPLAPERSPEPHPFFPILPISFSPQEEGGRIPRAPVAGRSFESGGLLGEAFRIYFANFLPFVILTAVAFSPLFYFAIFPPAPGLRESLVGYGRSWLCTPIATAGVTYGVFQHMRRRDCSVGDTLRGGLSCLLPALLVAILQAVVTGAGTLFCFFPGILVSIVLAVAVPVAVEERSGVIAAFRRSSELTDGYRWEVFGVFFLLGVLNLGLALLVILLTGGLGTPAQTQAFHLTSRFANLVPTGLSATASAVMYYRLRSVKESIDVEEIASVFD